MTTNALTTQQNNVSTWLSPNSFEAAMKIVALMQKCGTMPAHIKNEGDAFRVVVQSAKWGMDPFAVAECTSLVHGRMCYEGKLVAAVLQQMNAIDGYLDFEFSGSGQDMAVVVSGRRTGETKLLTCEGSVKSWRTHQFGKNQDGSQGRETANNWDKNPKDQLIYKGTRQWARLWCPGAMVGIYTPDEFDDDGRVLKDASASATVVADPPAAGRKRRAAAEEKQPAAQEGDALVDAIVKHEDAKQEAAHAPQQTTIDNAVPTQGRTVDECVNLARLVYGNAKTKGVPALVNEKWKIAKTQDLGGDDPLARGQYWLHLRAEALKLDPTLVLP